MKKLSSFLVALVVSLAVMPTAGAFYMEAGENVLITENQLDDVYLMAGNVNVKADVFGDLYVTGGSVVINGDVSEDLVILGGKVTVSGNVGGDVRIFGGEVLLLGDVGDDLIIGGGLVDVGIDSVIGGSLVSGAGILTIDGTVKHDIRGVMGMLLVNGIVEGDVVVTIEDTMTFANDAEVVGDLKYSALLETSVPDGVVGGEIAFNKFERDTILQTLTYVFFIQKLLSYLGSLVLALILVFFAPRLLIKAGLMTHNNVLKSFGVGLITLIILFVGAILLLVTIVGIPISMMAFGLMIFIFYFAKIFVACWFSSMVLNFKKKLNRWKLFGVMAVALLVYDLLGVIPKVGWVIDVILFSIGVGIFTLLKIEYYQFLRSKQML